MFQQPQLLDGLSLRENVLLPAIWHGAAERAERIQATDRMLERLGIAEAAERDAAALSGGQRQRAGLARALVNGPAICFADEPTGALDSTSADAVLEILGRLNQDGLTIVMVTHDHDVAAHADRVIRVVDGRVDAATRRLPGDAT